MIKEVTIKDNTKSPIDYIVDLKNFSNNKSYKFSDEINIIIGENGCGKSTLLNLISEYMLCKDNLCTHTYNEPLMYRSLFNDSIDDIEVMDGVEVKADYKGVVYRYLAHNETTKNDILSSSENFFTYLSNTSLSTGETVINTLSKLFDFSFNNLKINFPIEELIKLSESSNDIWKKRILKLIEYYKNNSIKITKEEFKYTFLLDEIDRNLDIKHINDIYNVLSYRKPYTQLICVVHNPILIYKLSKLDYVNIIEMTDGYLQSIKDVIDNL